MKTISLLPAEVRSYQRSSKKRNSFIILGLTVVLAFIAAYIFLSISISGPQDSLAALKQERAADQARISELKQYEIMLDSAKAREAVIEKAMSDNPEWVGLLNGLFGTIPSDVWLEGFQAKYDKGAGDITLDGFSGKFSSISAWLSDIQKTKGITEARCAYVNKDDSQGGPRVKFEITAKLEKGPVYSLPVTGGAN